MKLKCEECKRTFTIPDDKLPKVGKSVILPCPVCKGDIRIPPPDQREEEENGGKNLLEGTALQKRILMSVIKLPTMPQVAQKVQQLIAETDVSFGEIERIILTDQTIVTQLLKLANSAYYGFRGRISSVKHAISLLGTRALKEVLLMSCASRFLKNQLDGYGHKADDLWRHSLAVALGAKILAERVKEFYKEDIMEDAFAAGLIHDIGKLILDPYIQERKHLFDQHAREAKTSFLEVERRLLGFDHAQIAARVCDKWLIPSHMTLAIRHHHSPPPPEESNALIYVIHAADAISIMSGIGLGMDGMLYKIDENAMNFLRIDRSEIPGLCGLILQRVEEILSEFPQI